MRFSRLAIACLGILACVSGSGPDGRDGAPESARLLSQLIRFDTVNPPGDERPAAQLLVDVLDEAGLEARLIATPSGGSKVGRAAAWARLRGNGAKRPLVLLSHLDVVPADGARWAVPPFDGVIGGGYVVGRGALDAKGVAVVHARTLIELARRGSSLERDVILLATPDEETGGSAGAGFIVSERPDLLDRAEYLLTEGGGILAGPGRTHVWGVTIVEKSPCWIRLTATGAPGHSSTGDPEAATHRLVAALERLRRFQTPVRVLPEVARMFRELAPLSPPDERAALRNLGWALDHDFAFRERFLRDHGRRALVRDTLAITVLEGGPRTNVQAAQAVAEIDARLLPGGSCSRFIEVVERVVADPAVRVKTILAFESRASPDDTDLFRAIRSVAAQVDPDSRVVPRVIGGFTDAHYFRDLGIVAYGFVPRWLPPSETRGVHGPNERISVENLERGVETMVRLIEEFAGI